MLKQRLAIFVPVVAVWLVIMAFAFKPSITDRYFVDPVGVTKYTDRNNGVATKNMTLRVPVVIGQRRFEIPSAYLSRIGVWNPDTATYGGMVHMAAEGERFGPMPGASADSQQLSLSIWLEQRVVPVPNDIIRNPPKPKELPATLAEFEANLERDPLAWLRGGMARAKDLDKAGLIAYRDSFWGETYVGKRDAGNLLIFHCKSPEQPDDKICEVFDARYPDHDILVKYAYPKRYIERWRHFDAGVNQLVAGFKRS